MNCSRGSSPSTWWTPPSSVPDGGADSGRESLRPRRPCRPHGRRTGPGRRRDRQGATAQLSRGGNHAGTYGRDCTMTRTRPRHGRNTWTWWSGCGRRLSASSARQRATAPWIRRFVALNRQQRRGSTTRCRVRTQPWWRPLVALCRGDARGSGRSRRRHPLVAQVDRGPVRRPRAAHIPNGTRRTGDHGGTPFRRGAPAIARTAAPHHLTAAPTASGRCPDVF